MSHRASLQLRVGAAVVAVTVAVGFGVLAAAAYGWIDLIDWFGVCGFRQRHGLPCPGCYWTTAGMEFVRGHLVRAFVVQPAATVFYGAALITGVFALLVAGAGVNFAFLHPPARGRIVRYALIAAVVILLGGWAVTLARAWAQGMP